MKNKKSSVLSFAAATSLGAFACTSSCMSMVLSVVASNFPDVPYTNIYQLITIPSLVCLLTALAWGPFIGRKIKYKTVIMIGLALYFVGSLSPIFITGSFGLLMATRVIFGVGLGSVGWSSALVMANYSGHEQARYLSINSLVYSVSSMIINTLSGILGGWGYIASYFIYFIGLIPFVLVLFFLQEPETKETVVKETAAKEAKKDKEKLKLAPIAVFWSFMGFVILLLKYPVALQVSVFTDEMGLANSTVVAGTLMTAYQIGGFLGAMAFPIVNKKGSRWILAGLMFLVSVNMILCLCTKSVVLYYVGYFLGGIGFNTSGLVRSTYIGSTNPKNSMGLMSSVGTAFIYGSMYVTPYYTALVNPIFNNMFGTNYEHANWWFCLIGFTVLGIIFLVKDPRPKVYRELMEAPEAPAAAAESAE